MDEDVLANTLAYLDSWCHRRNQLLIQQCLLIQLGWVLSFSETPLWALLIFTAIYVNELNISATQNWQSHKASTDFHNSRNWIKRRERTVCSVNRCARSNNTKQIFFYWSLVVMAFWISWVLWTLIFNRLGHWLD